MKARFFIILAVAIAPISASAAIKSCPKTFVSAWDAWNWESERVSKEMPVPKEPCIMQRTSGRGAYLCNQDGCGMTPDYRAP